MSQPKVFITRRLLTKLEQLQKIATIEVWEERQPPPYKVLLKKVKTIDGLLCLLTDQIDQQLIQTAGTSRDILPPLTRSTEYSGGFQESLPGFSCFTGRA
jgi:glyoxylate reductase